MVNLFKMFLEITLTASAMLLIVMAVRALFSKRMNPAVMTVLWMLVLMRLCIPYTFESPLHIGSVFPAPAVQTAAVEPAEPGHPQSVYSNVQPGPAISYNEPADIIEQTDTAVKTAGNQAFPWWSVLTGIWLTGVAAVLLFTVVQGIAFRRKIKRCRHISDGTVYTLINRHKKTLGLRRTVTVVEYDKLHTPAVLGYFKPVILLPRKFLQTDAQTISCILLHELCHIKRRDILKSYLWLAAKALHWFNPLVWAAFRMFKDDIELCCDDAVTRRLEIGSRYEYTQSLVDVFRLSKRGDSLPVTVSFFESHARLTQRVMRMLNPKKQLKSAVVISVLLAVVMVIAGFTTACSPSAPTQPAPEKTNTEVLSEKSPVPEQSAEATPTPAPRLDYDAPERWTDSAEGDDGRLKVNFDADIVLPGVNVLATYHVQPDAAFSQEMADQLISALFGDAQVYQMANPTKQMLQKEIEKIGSDYDKIQSGSYVFPDGWDDDAKQARIHNIKLYLDNLKEKLKTAADESTLVPLDTSLNVDQYGMSAINGMADLGRDEWADFHLGNHSNMGSNIYFHNDGGYTVHLGDGIARQAPVGDLNISETEARKQANKLLANLGLTDFVYYSSSISGKNGPDGYAIMEDSYAHMLIYARNLGGITLAPSMAPVPPSEDMTFSQYIKYQPEFILITVNDQGICDFQWMNKIQVEDTAETSVKLMPFADISELIKQKIIERNIGLADSLSNEIGSGKNWWKTDEYIFNIDRIALEYARIPVNGDLDRQLIVPVWSVYGSTEWRFWKEADGEKVKDSVIDKGSRIVFTINALDGSVI